MRTIILWDAERGQRLAAVFAPNANALAVSPDGTRFGEAGADRRIRIRNAETLEVVRELRVHDEEVVSVGWHPTLPFIVTSSEDQSVRIWNVQTGALVEEMGNLNGALGNLILSPDGRSVGGELKAKGVSSRPFQLYEPASFRSEAKDVE